MKIYLYCPFECDIKTFFETIHAKAEDIFCLTDYFDELIEICPKSEGLKSYKFSISKILTNKHIKAIKIDEDLWFCQLLPDVEYLVDDENIMPIKIGDEECIIRYFVGEYGYFSFFGKDVFIKRKIRQIKSLSFSNKKIAQKDYLFVIINCGEKKYLFLLDKKQLIWDGYFKEINILENEILILEDNNSCLGEKLVVKVDAGANKITKYPVIYKKKSLEFSSPILAFLDSIIVHDYSQMKKYCAIDLTEICNENILLFCGEFDDYLLLDEGCVLLKNFEAQKVLRFKVENNVIVDIFD